MSTITIAIPARLEDVERKIIEATLQRLGGHQRHACVVLGISPKTMYNKLKRYRQDDAAALEQLKPAHSDLVG